MNSNQLATLTQIATNNHSLSGNCLVDIVATKIRVERLQFMRKEQKNRITMSKTSPEFVAVSGHLFAKKVSKILKIATLFGIYSLFNVTNMVSVQSLFHWSASFVTSVGNLVPFPFSRLFLVSIKLLCSCSFTTLLRFMITVINYLCYSNHVTFSEYVLFYSVFSTRHLSCNTFHSDFD